MTPMAEQPTGEAQREWTPEYVQGIADKANIADQNTAIADAHNAALAAERDKRIEAERERDEFSRGCDRLAEKLAYERMKQSSETKALR
jgi:hypothetical protein